ncbi:Uncharacterized protein FWK35_00019849 [Aphis craccivora]|uniref:Uncharacterized protein n=1 Tax=Aphis craccivora TaxID=307492 RepID=A0A6G0XZB4_APHCR|nr:Uncharacterized protein FWK35_00019849 [Aphis craccivora]
MRQKGKPTAFTTCSANEIGWLNLLKLLYKLKNNGQDISEHDLALLNYMEKSLLVNEDAVTCAIYFNKLVNTLLTILQPKRFSPFEVVDEHLEFDIVEITRKLSVDIINNVELSSQEAVWYLLREPMSKSSIAVTYIPTVWPIERQRIRKTLLELEDLDNESTDIWKENWFSKYKKGQSR